MTEGMAIVHVSGIRKLPVELPQKRNVSLEQAVGIKEEGNKFRVRVSSLRQSKSPPRTLSENGIQWWIESHLKNVWAQNPSHCRRKVSWKVKISQNTKQALGVYIGSTVLWSFAISSISNERYEISLRLLEFRRIVSESQNLYSISTRTGSEPCLFPSSLHVCRPEGSLCLPIHRALNEWLMYPASSFTLRLPFCRCSLACLRNWKNITASRWLFGSTFFALEHNLSRP